MKKYRSIIKKKIEKIALWLEKERAIKKTSLANSIKLGATAILVLGISYQYSFFNSFGINYYLYFDVSDPLVAFYKKGTLILYSILLLFPLTLPLNINTGKKDAIQNSESLLFTIIASIIGGFVIFFFFEVHHVPKDKLLGIYLFLLFVASIALTTFANEKSGLILNFAVCILFFAILGKADAVNANHQRLTFNIRSGKTSVLKQKDSCTYFIGNNRRYYFLKDTCNDSIYAYPTNTISAISFSNKTN